MVLQAPAPSAAHTCPIVDAIAPLATVAGKAAGKPDQEQIAAYRRAMIDANPGLYTPSVLGLTPGPLMDRQILASLKQARAATDRGMLEQRVRTQIAATSHVFRVFTDFKCDFPVYLADTLGVLDGAGRVVDGRHALVIGIDSVERELPQLSLPVFLTHEFFHRYHFQAAGFSDDPGSGQQIWRAIWAEGLATYVSQGLVPGTSTAQALLSANLEQQARPLVPQMAAELFGGMDRIDPGLYNEYFTGGSDAGRHGLPQRAGYYVGYLVAQRVAQRHDINQLAHLQGGTLYDEIAGTLQQMATLGGVGHDPDR